MKTLVVLVLAAGLGSVGAACQSCATALAEGLLVADGGSLVLRAPTGETNVINWPAGYSVRQEQGQLVLVDALGEAKARVGDKVQIQGGLGPDGVFQACGDVRVDSPP